MFLLGMRRLHNNWRRPQQDSHQLLGVLLTCFRVEPCR